MAVELYIGNQCSWAQHPSWNYRSSDQNYLDSYELYRMSRTPDRLDIFVCSANSTDLPQAEINTVEAFFNLSRPARERFFCLANDDLQSRFLDILGQIPDHLIEATEVIVEIDPGPIRSMNLPVTRRYMRLRRNPVMEMLAINCEPYHLSDTEIFNRALSQFSDVAEFLGRPEYRTYPDLASALNSLGDPNDFQANAWGEIHPPNGYDQRITMDIFTDEFVPYLRTHRRQNLVTEFVASDIPQAEIDWVVSGHEPDSEHTPGLIGFSEYANGFSYRTRLLQSCGRNGINVWAGGITALDMRQSLAAGHPGFIISAISQNSSRLMRELLENNQTVDFYGGVGHIRINDHPLSFGNLLSSQHTYRAIEIIHLPTLSDHLRGGEYRPFELMRLGGLTVYPQTVGVVRHNDNYYTLIVTE